MYKSTFAPGTLRFLFSHPHDISEATFDVDDDHVVVVFTKKTTPKLLDGYLWYSNPQLTIFYS